MLLSEVFNNPEKQWTQDGNHVYAEIVSIQPYKTDQYGFKQPVTLKDLGGNQMAVTVQTKYEKGLMTPTMIGAKASWRLKWYGSQRGGKQLVGYCLDKLPNGGQATPQSTQQAAPQAAQASNAPKDVDWDAKDQRSANQTALNGAALLLDALSRSTDGASDVGIEMALEMAEKFSRWIYTFKVNQPSAATPSPAMNREDYGPSPPEADVPTGDQIPF